MEEYPKIWIDGYKEYNLEMKSPKNYEGLVKKINDNFKNNFEGLARKILKEFEVEIQHFNWDDRGLISIVLPGGRSCGIYFANFQKGMIFKNIESTNKAVAFLDIISTYYQALQELD